MLPSNWLDTSLAARRAADDGSGYVMHGCLEYSPSVSRSGSASAAGRMAGVPPSDAFRDDLIGEMKYLRALAISLSGSVSVGDDLTQETLLRAWSKSDQLHAGTILRAWLLTILRNIFYTNFRKRAREVQDGGRRVRESSRGLGRTGRPYRSARVSQSLGQASKSPTGSPHPRGRERSYL